jgi:hypothetical protein
MRTATSWCYLLRAFTNNNNQSKRSSPCLLALITKSSSSRLTIQRMTPPIAVVLKISLAPCLHGWMISQPTLLKQSSGTTVCGTTVCMGHNSWSPSHSTAGNAAKEIAAHCSGKPTNTKCNSTAEAPGESPAKKGCFDKPPYCSVKAAFASNGKSLQELLKTCCAAAAEDGDH